MSTFSRRELLQAFTGKQQNPLRTIGFSAELLRLGLSENELWEYAQKTATRLVALIHPDAGSEERKASAAIREAHRLLKSHASFRDALEELRGEYSEVRTAENEARRAAEAATARERAEASALQRQLEENARLASENSLLRGRLNRSGNGEVTSAKTGFHRPGAQVVTPREVGRIIALRVTVKTSQKAPGSPEQLAKRLEQYESDLTLPSQKRRALANLHADLIGSGFTSKPLGELAGEAAGLPVPALSWNTFEALSRLGAPTGKLKPAKVPSFEEVAKRSALPPAKLAELCASGFSQVIETVGRGRLVKIAEIFPEVINLSGGRVDGKLIVGSVFPHQIEKPEIVRPTGLKLGTYPEDLEYPLICEGAFLVSCKPIPVRAEGHSAEERARSYVRELGRTMREDMETSYLVVEIL